jgi:hypothetical protein
MDIMQHLQLLGTRQRDVITGLAGVVTSISFDVNGCIQAVLKPPLDKDGKISDGVWIDLQRLEPNGEPACAPFPYERFPDARVQEVREQKFAAGSAEKPVK